MVSNGRMCGFIFTYTNKFYSDSELELANQFIRYRGPTASHSLVIPTHANMHVTLLHNLLDISGKTIVQPLSKDGTHILFNGEIYNHAALHDANSDTETLLNLYREGDDAFKAKLDGEFVILAYDENKNTLDILTDPFLTKPLYFGRSDNPSEFACASYPSALLSLGFSHISDAQPNTHYQIRLDKHHIQIHERHPVHTFHVAQTSTHLDTWCEAFIEAVRKRAMHGGHQPMIALSSGYDSGCVALAMQLLNIKFNAYTLAAGENLSVLQDRFAFCRDVLDQQFFIDPISKKEVAALKNEAALRIENLQYHHRDGDGYLQMLSDPGAIGSYIVAQRATEHGEIVNLSGSGGDEIYSDYGHQGQKFASHSEFGGQFPDAIEDYFPWKKFYGDSQRSYLMKEEFVFGSFGIESRYPFLDTSVVGEFLKLSPELKNAHYKAPLHYFMRRHGFPFEENAKRGFAIRKAPLGRRIKQSLKRFLS